MSVKLRKRKNADGTTSLRLDIYKDGRRTIETLKHLQLDKPSNLADRENNKEKIQQAEAISVKRAAELEAKLKAAYVTKLISTAACHMWASL